LANQPTSGRTNDTTAHNAKYILAQKKKLVKPLHNCGQSGAYYPQQPKIFARSDMNMLDRIALILVVLGALNWGSIGLFQFDIVAWIFGGQGAIVSRILYTLVALAGIWCVSLLFRERSLITAEDDVH